MYVLQNYVLELPKSQHYKNNGAKYKKDAFLVENWGHFNGVFKVVILQNMSFSFALTLVLHILVQGLWLKTPLSSYFLEC